MNQFKLQIGFIALLVAATRLSFAQNLTGTALASNTGAPISGALVTAVAVTSSPSQPPVLYQTRTDANGQFSLTVAGGQYRMCASGGGPYLNPCLWGGAVTVTPGPAAITLQLRKGALFLARVHTSTQALRQAEVLHGTAIAARVSGGPFASFPLPLLYESASARDYGEVLPLNLAMTLLLTSRSPLKDSTGATVGTPGVPLTISNADFAPASFFAVKFGGTPAMPAAKILHFYTNP